MDVVLALKRLGFTHNEILYDLTAKQVRHYHKKAMKLDEDILKQQSAAMRVAYHADEKQYGKFIKGEM